MLFFGLGITVFVRSPFLLLLYVLPLLAAVFIARRGTAVDKNTIVVTAVFGRQTVAWADVTGLFVNGRDGISAVSGDGSALRLPYVRARHLPVLSEITEGTVPALPAAQADGEAEGADEPGSTGTATARPDEG
ncbi:MAG: hypothetical protein JWM76_4513 [Pseudonocardiales bacterium]|nr:hypothetical protein [Pseudonocardiales bacterium]